MKEKFYQKTWFIWLMIFIFWPVGLVLLWMSQKYSKKIKLIVTALFIAVVAFGISNSPNKSQEEQVASTSSTVTTETAKPEKSSQEATKPKDDKYHHLADAENVLQKIYNDTALKLGVGAPTVDVAFTSYRQWESAPGLTETDGEFELSSEDGLTHKFNIRWGKNSNDIIRIVIDGKRIYYNEDLQVKYMDSAN